MKEKVLSLLGTVSLLVGIVLVMCLPYAEAIRFWNVRAGSIIGVAMIAMGIAIMGMVAEKR